MSTFDPQSLLDTPLSEIEAPKSLPDGTYIWNISERKYDKLPERVVQGEKKPESHFVEFKLQAVGHLPDVEEADVAEALNGKSLSDIKKNARFYITHDALYRIKEFAVHCGAAESEEDARPLRELIEECLGHQVCGLLRSKPSDRDPNRSFSNIESFAPVPE